MVMVGDYVKEEEILEEEDVNDENNEDHNLMRW